MSEQLSNLVVLCMGHPQVKQELWGTGFSSVSDSPQQVPHTGRLEMQKYQVPEIHFMVCGTTISRLRASKTGALGKRIAEMSVASFQQVPHTGHLESQKYLVPETHVHGAWLLVPLSAG